MNVSGHGRSLSLTISYEFAMTEQSLAFSIGFDVVNGNDMVVNDARCAVL